MKRPVQGSEALTKPWEPDIYNDHVEISSTDAAGNTVTVVKTYPVSVEEIRKRFKDRQGK
jgi:hypothetical protein